MANSYGSNPWTLQETEIDPAKLLENASVFSLGNGTIGIRGSFEEGCQLADYHSAVGTYINGLYESEPIVYGEQAFGYAKTHQVIQNIANPLNCTITVNGFPVTIDEGDIKQYERVLDMRAAVLHRTVRWIGPDGSEVLARFERFVSSCVPDLVCCKIEIQPVSNVQSISIISSIVPISVQQRDVFDPRVGSELSSCGLNVTDSRKLTPSCLLVYQQTESSKMAAATVLNHHSSGMLLQASDDTTAATYLWDGVSDAISLEKQIGITAGAESQQNQLIHKAQEAATSNDYDTALQMHTEWMRDFWGNADVSISGDDTLQQGIRFNLLQLLNSAARTGDRSVAAKGLSGAGYDGHYFWDTETYVTPFFMYTMPDLAKGMLKYRYNTLSKARRRARTMGHDQGALFPWRTINGEECSAYYPAGTAQYHINADIAAAIVQYTQVTGDIDFMRDYGLEILIETARFWMSLGFFNPNRDGQFCINCVTGPDEYTVLVNNNCYTNLMVKANLIEAVKWSNTIRTEYPLEYSAIHQRLALSESEIPSWQNAADKMYLPYDQEKKLFLQDDGLYDRQPWAISDIPRDKFPLLLHYHPLVIYRHQICKQADVVLAALFQGQEFSQDEKKIAFDYYEAITTHDSSLSYAIFGILAGEIGYRDKAMDYFSQSALLDLEDAHGNSRQGLHIANMGGSWMSIVYGFAGMRHIDGVLQFKPWLPDDWTGYSFRIRLNQSSCRISVSRNDSNYELVEGSKFEFVHNGQKTVLTESNPIRTLSNS